MLLRRSFAIAALAAIMSVFAVAGTGTPADAAANKCYTKAFSDNVDSLYGFVGTVKVTPRWCTNGSNRISSVTEANMSDTNTVWGSVRGYDIKPGVCYDGTMGYQTNRIRCKWKITQTLPVKGIGVTLTVGYWNIWTTLKNDGSVSNTTYGHTSS